MSSRNKKFTTAIWLYLPQFTAIWCNSGLALAPVFGLGGACAFLVFFFGEVSDKGKPVPPPSGCLAVDLTEQRLFHALNVPVLDGVSTAFFAFLTTQDDKLLSLCRFAFLAAKRFSKKQREDERDGWPSQGRCRRIRAKARISLFGRWLARRRADL